MIHVFAEIKAIEGKRDELIAAFRNLTPKVLAEEGCLQYETAVDTDSGLELQGPLNSNLLYVVEKWESVPALHAHLAAPHMLAHRDATSSIVESLKIKVLHPVV